MSRKQFFALTLGVLAAAAAGVVFGFGLFFAAAVLLVSAALWLVLRSVLREDAEKGIPTARTVIGAMYLKDVDGFGADPEAAARWLAPAAERGEPQAC
ncbi:MAG: hypothetical protein IIX84_07055, partial [Oscillospiraceae bacterium]|nr:hypothetical protein [Oscillospiraceae bacterium]